jgi:hypothetical protein
MWVLKLDGRQTTLSQAISSRSLNARSRMWPFMVYEQYDFARNPIVTNQVFFLQSKCSCCDFIVLARSLEELLQEEKRHRGQCRLMRAKQ